MRKHIIDLFNIVLRGLEEKTMVYYIPLYGSEPITLKGISKEMEIVEWADVPEKVRNLLERKEC